MIEWVHMNDDQFDKMFRYIEDFRSEVSTRFDREHDYFEERIDQLTNLIDGYAGRLDSYAQEMAALDHKIARLERYIHVLADSAGIDLEKLAA